MKTNKEILMIEKHKQELIRSFADAIKAVGGDPVHFLRDDLTLGEMMDGLAQNGIRFTYVKGKGDY